MVVTDQQIAAFSPKMQEAVKFVQYWNLADSIPEFIDVMGWPLERKSWVKASQFATMFRKQGIKLKKLRDKKIDYDWSYLKQIAEQSIAHLGRQKEAAEIVAGDINGFRAEAARIVQELRKFKHKAIAYEAMLAEGD